MKKCPHCAGDHPIWREYGNGKCSTCNEVKIRCAMLRSQKGGLDLASLADTLERSATEHCPDCLGTATCQYCMGMGMVP